MKEKKWMVIGLMSGTSLDGLDIIYTCISYKHQIYNFEIYDCETIKYPKSWEFKLRSAFCESEDIVSKLNNEYGLYLGDVVNKFLKEHKINKVDFIASHGHTIFHKPNEGYTLQIGDGQMLSNKTGLKVICDFRTQDVEYGGQGAPLVPIGDLFLFSEFDYCLNLGGFANISFEKKGKRIAFDICPVNIVLNYYSKLIGYEFDENGFLAEKGNINYSLLKDLNELPFYFSPIPKSLGFEFVKEFIFPLIDSYSLKVEDVLRTFVAHISTQLTNCLENRNQSKLLITGGGAFNSFLIDEIKNNTQIEIVIPENNIINYKEALIFSLLGVLRDENKVNCLSSVTGAKKDHCSGKIFLKQI